MSVIRPLLCTFAAVFALALNPIAEVSAHPTHFGHPGWGPRPPMYRPMHRPPPPPHHRYHRVSHWDSDWFWGPLAAGVTLWGLNELVDSHRARQVEPAQSQVVIPAAPQTQQPATVYWCESEKGFYPQVRACPEGWVALPANAVPNN